MFSIHMCICIYIYIYISHTQVELYGRGLCDAAGATDDNDCEYGCRPAGHHHHHCHQPNATDRQLTQQQQQTNNKVELVMSSLLMISYQILIMCRGAIPLSFNGEYLSLSLYPYLSIFLYIQMYVYNFDQMADLKKTVGRKKRERERE